MRLIDADKLEPIYIEGYGDAYSEYVIDCAETFPVPLDREIYLHEFAKLHNKIDELKSKLEVKEKERKRLSENIDFWQGKFDELEQRIAVRRDEARLEVIDETGKLAMLFMGKDNFPTDISDEEGHSMLYEYAKSGYSFYLNGVKVNHKLQPIKE